MSYIYETHCHTKISSKCGECSGEELVAHYKQLGYSGIIVTDHFINGNSNVDKTLSWKEQMEFYCKGYEDAKLAGDKASFDVFFGLEYNNEGTEFLVYGVDKQWLIDHPEIMTVDIHGLYRLVNEAGGVMIQAHPFRQAAYIRCLRLFPDCVDAVEAYNAHNVGRANTMAEFYVKTYGLLAVGGTDFHKVSQTQYSGVIVEKKFESVHDYVKLVKNKGKIDVMRLAYDVSEERT